MPAVPTTNLLAFDTSTEFVSVALASAGGLFQRTAPGGAQASATLIPTLEAVMQEAGIGFHQLDAVVFGRGPGSFTGLRTACAAAQGIAYGARSAAHAAGLPVLPIDTLSAVAEEAHAVCGAQAVVATLDARMDEVYACALQRDPATGRWAAQSEVALFKPEAVEVPTGWTLAGNARAAYGERLAPGAVSVHVLPNAAALLRLAPALIAAGGLVAAADALPLYVRDKVAKTTAERLAERHAVLSAALEAT